MSNEDEKAWSSEGPMNFADIVGQEPLVRALQLRLSAETGRGRHLTLIGPIGSGKKTIAQLYSQVLVCDASENGAPCHVCKECKGVKSGGSWAYVPIDASRQGDEETVRTLIERDGTLNTASIRIVLFDRAEELSPSAADAALKTLERETETVFIFLVSDDKTFSGALRSRCDVFRMRRMGIEEIAGHLAAICERASIAYEAAALGAIAQMAGGSYGAALTAMATMRGGALTLPRALVALGQAWGPAALHCYRAMLADRFDEALEFFERAGSDGAGRVRAMQALFLQLELWRELGTAAPVVNSALAELPPDEWAEADAELKRFGERHAAEVGHLVSAAARFWRDVRLDDPSDLVCQRFLRHLRRWHDATGVDLRFVKEQAR